MDTTDSIDTALSQAGHQADITPELIKLDSNRITSDSDAPEEEFLFKMSGTPCFPRGDLTTVTGPAKSGKTYFIYPTSNALDFGDTLRYTTHCDRLTLHSGTPI